MRLSRPVGVLASGFVSVLLVGTIATTSAVAAGNVGTASSSPAVATALLEARKTDRVPLPETDWWNCEILFGAGECTTVALPLDYDEPKGPTTEIAVLRVKATDPAKKIGTLFINPGGPGGSGVTVAAEADYFLSDAVRERFDIVGFDPRGTNFSDNVQCWKNLGETAADLRPFLQVPFPHGADQEKAYVEASKKFGTACSSYGTPLSGSMSTAEVARDMDVLRRLFGDKKLTYLGFSYGSYLGTVYANLFPSRVRALTIDGVIDPEAWAGTKSTRNIPQTARLKSGEAADKALREMLDRCADAGEDYCSLAGWGDPTELYEKIAARLKEKPIVLRNMQTGEIELEFDYQTLVSWLLTDMYVPYGYLWVDADLTYLLMLLEEEAGAAIDRDDVEMARTALRTKFQFLAEQNPTAQERAKAQRRAGFGFPYDNRFESFQAVLCTDGLNPADAASWPGHAAAADKAAPGFGPLWTWASAPCAEKTWTVKDEDAYRGNFKARTSAPILVVGNYWDPATSYEGAVAAAKIIPNSRLLSSDSWGHTAYGTSECVTDAIDAYLISGKLPAKNTVCVGDEQPFTWVPEDPEVPWSTDDLVGPDAGPSMGAKTAEGSDLPERLPPVVPPLPGAGPRF